MKLADQAVSLCGSSRSAYLQLLSAARYAKQLAENEERAKEKRSGVNGNAAEVIKQLDAKPIPSALSVAPMAPACSSNALTAAA